MAGATGARAVGGLADVDVATGGEDEVGRALPAVGVGLDTGMDGCTGLGRPGGGGRDGGRAQAEAEQAQARHRRGQEGSSDATHVEELLFQI
jgi:hypothetical protein